MDTIGILKKLISFRTTEDRTPEIKKAIAYIEGLLKKKGIWTKKYYLNGKPVMYACTQRVLKPDILLIPHLDVVEGEDSQFIPRQKGNILRARGACDCKNNVTVVIKSLMHFAGSGKTVGAIFTTDEEIGGATTSLLVKKGHIGKLNLMLDGGRAIVYAQKGVLNLKVSAHGTAGHGSKPWLSTNANEELIKAYTKIKKIIPDTTARNRWQETVNLGIMQGGDVINKVADQSHMWLNTRLTEKCDYRKLVKKIRGIKPVSKVKVLALHPFYYLDPKQPLVRQFKKFMEKALKCKLPLERMHGATDAHNFGKVKQPLIITGVGGGHGAHSRTEWVNVKEVVRYEKALISYIEAAV